MAAMTGAQAKFIKDLLKDLQILFAAGKPEATERDCVNWFGGVLRKHITRLSRLYSSWDEVNEDLDQMGSGEARALIGALGDIRDRMETKLPRASLVTPSYILTAIWVHARRNGYSKPDVEAMVHGITEGGTKSTRNLRRGEALKVLERVGGSNTVIPVSKAKKHTAKKGVKA